MVTVSVVNASVCAARIFHDDCDSLCFSVDDVLSGPQVDAEDEPKLKLLERRCTL